MKLSLDLQIRAWKVTRALSAVEASDKSQSPDNRAFFRAEVVRANRTLRYLRHYARGKRA